MNLIKFKRVCFLSLSILYCLAFIIVGIKITFLLYPLCNPISLSIFLQVFQRVTIFVIIEVLALGITSIIDHIIDRNRKHICYSFVNTHRIFFWTTKPVYHSELGYFMCRVTADRIWVYKQGFFIMDLLYDCPNTNPELVAKLIKDKLDELYSNILSARQKDETDKKRVDNFMSWDGFLDKKGKRDEKLNQLLNK